MAASLETSTRTKHSKAWNKARHGGTRAVGISGQSELNLNQAFDGLNRCELRTRVVPSELGNIIQKSLDSAILVYTEATRLHLEGQFKTAKHYAEAVCQFCVLMDNLAEEQTDNVLQLPMPPQMPKARSKKTAATRNLHPSLKLLDSMIRQRMTRLSKFYRSRLANYAEVLSRFSKCLQQIQKVH